MTLADIIFCSISILLIFAMTIAGIKLEKDIQEKLPKMDVNDFD